MHETTTEDEFFWVGDTRCRGPHRERVWGTSLVHYNFLDKPRRLLVAEEPKAANSTVLGYDSPIGSHIEKLIDFPHKRLAFEKCSRERLVQLSPFKWDGRETVANHND